HKKFVEAERILSDLLREESNNIHFLILSAELSLLQDKIDKAKQIVDIAIGLSPDFHYLFYLKSRIAIQEDNFNDAEKHILQAIELDPYVADYFALLANIKLVRKQFSEALETANLSLEIDAENLEALNVRS